MKKWIKNILISRYPKLMKKYIFWFIPNFIHIRNKIAFTDPEIIFFIELFNLNKSGIFFDIGANNGIYTYYAEKYLINHNIHAFEPNPDLFTHLVYLFPSTNINKEALSNKEGESSIKIPYLKGIKNNSLGTLKHNYTEINETHANYYTIQTITLDHYLDSKHIEEIDFIKIDVEGYELEVLEGAKNIFKSCQPVMMVEIEKKHHESKTVLQIINQIIVSLSIKSRYKAYTYSQHDKKLIEIMEEPNQNISDWGTNRYINNFIFITEDHPYFKQKKTDHIHV